MEVTMSNSPDLKAITKKFFAAYDAHDVDGMLTLCADGAQGRYLPYGKKSVMPIRGGLEQIWRGLLGAVPDFGVEVDEMIQAEGNIVVVQALLGGAMPADVPGLVTKGKSDRIAHAYIIRYDASGKITRLDCYWDNTAINAIMASAL
jgi:ketosteroid isomerase-like protein